MTDVRQSPEYVKYIESIGWQVEKISKGNVFVKKFPLIGSLIKIQRIDPPIPFEEIDYFPLCFNLNFGIIFGLQRVRSIIFY